MGYVTYTRKQYLKWCKNNGKTPLPEDIRNKFTECGYPIISHVTYGETDYEDSDQYYKSRW